MASATNKPSDSILGAVLVVLLVLIALPVVWLVVMMPVMGTWGGGHMWNGGMWEGTGAWTWLGMWLILLLLLVGGGYLLYRAIGGSGGNGSDAALDELRLAYARGELSDDEFEDRRERLQGP